MSGAQTAAGELSRAAGHGRPAAPARLVHLGLGNFFRAHQAWYTDRAPDAGDWGIAAFTGRSAELADALNAQEGLYTLVTRAADGDRFDVLSSLSRTHPAADYEAWLGYLASPDVRAVTITVTEAGYVRGADGGLDRDRPQVQADVETLRHDLTALVRTAPARLVAGCAARRRAEAGPLTLVPCDNLPDNGAVVARVVRDLAEMVDPGLAGWLAGSIAFATTMVDRITPKTTQEDLHTVKAATGLDDRAPVATEPFSEWVLSGPFPGGRPRWEDAGATFTDDIQPYEQRKLWLLNGGHSLLAYAGSARGHQTVAEAVADETCRAWLEEWWSEASRHLSLPAADVAAYRAALLDRFANPRMHHRLDQIAADGSQKLPVRILPALRRERAAGRLPEGAARALAAWVCHLRGVGAAVTDARADQVVPLAAGPLPEAVPRGLAALDPALADDGDLVAAVLAHADQLGQPKRS
ncbi:MAG TPA: mannitol dehydrogenase family protein [Actinomycetota bacterium]|nr:mannitol dehydrogenase family protein [Actinomycetota bacterium]